MDSASDFVLPFCNSGTADASSGPCASAHLVGICGAGMNALASILLDLGWTLTGSDLQVDERLREALRRRGVSVHQGHDSHHLPPQARLLIHSAAIPADNPEREEARRRNIRELSYSQMVAELMQSRVGICIAGTHGKSTTAAMVAAILLESGREPSACLGAEICGMGKSGWAGRGNLLVVESCEYRRSFLDFSPVFSRHSQHRAGPFRLLCGLRRDLRSVPPVRRTRLVYRSFARPRGLSRGAGRVESSVSTGRDVLALDRCGLADLEPANDRRRQRVFARLSRKLLCPALGPPSRAAQRPQCAGRGGPLPSSRTIVCGNCQRTGAFWRCAPPIRAKGDMAGGDPGR